MNGFSKINSTKNKVLKEFYLRDEIRYVENRLKVQSVSNGHWWFDNGTLCRKLSIDEIIAYETINYSL